MTYETGDVVKYNGVCWEALIEIQGWPPSGLSELLPNMPNYWQQCY